MREASVLSGTSFKMITRQELYHKQLWSVVVDCGAMEGIKTTIE